MNHFSLKEFLSTEVKKISEFSYNTSYEDATYVSAVVGIHTNKFRVFKKDWFQPEYLDFEGYQFVGPAGYHEILTITYGDYMKLPPIAQRLSTHSEKYIWKQL